MKNHGIAAVTMSILFAASVYAANPFLVASNDEPVTANFAGTEWGDNISRGEIPLKARVITRRLAKMSWGAIFKIEFVDLKSRATEARKIDPEYYIVTDDRIVLLNDEKIDKAIGRISAMEKAPEFEPGNVYGIASGKFNREEGPWTTTIEIKSHRCIYLASHNSGHFKKIVWKKGVGLTEYSMGYGAMADGFRLKRAE